MIYILDEALSDTSHSRFMIDIIANHSTTSTTVIDIGTTVGSILSAVEQVSCIARPIDIVLCSWAISGNCTIDAIFNELAEQCWVVAAAGNNGQDIKDFSPARVANVITVGALNKSGNKATLSNYSQDKKLKWVPGTNYSVSWKTESGTSISAAIYAAFLSEALLLGNIEHVDAMIEDLKLSVRINTIYFGGSTNDECREI